MLSSSQTFSLKTASVARYHHTASGCRFGALSTGRVCGRSGASPSWRRHRRIPRPTPVLSTHLPDRCLCGLLTGALLRLTSMHGDPVVELQTNFGGGKTHSMLALYHFCSGIPLGELTGMDAVMKEAGITRLPP